MRRVWANTLFMFSDKPVTHGGLDWACRKPARRRGDIVGKREKSLAEKTGGRLCERKWVMIEGSACAYPESAVDPDTIIKGG